MAIIEFVKKKPQTAKSLNNLIDYILNPAKTADELCGGYNCDPKNAFADFIDTKREFGKPGGIQAIHFIQSFDPKENVSPETAKAIADELTNFAQFKGFQIVHAVHTDREHLHTHFVINSVNSETGYKWHQTKEELQALKDYSDKICRDHGLSVIEEKGDNRKSSGEYRSKKAGVSWKYELYLAVVNCMRFSNSRDEFIGNMAKLGYGVKWDDKKKYITFTTPDGKKCRNNKIYPPERFTKEALTRQFDYNREHKNHFAQKQKMNAVLGLMRIHGSLFNARNEQISKRPAQDRLEGDALEEYLYTLEQGGMWQNLKDEMEM